MDKTKNILIIGFGRIGRALAKRCLGFDMRVNVYDPYVDSKTINSYGGKKIENLDEAFKTLDYLSIHMPLNSKTKNLL